MPYFNQGTDYAHHIISCPPPQIFTTSYSPGSEKVTDLSLMWKPWKLISLTLFQPGGQSMPTILIDPPPRIFRPSYDPGTVRYVSRLRDRENSQLRPNFWLARLLYDAKVHMPPDLKWLYMYITRICVISYLFLDFFEYANFSVFS